MSDAVLNVMKYRGRLKAEIANLDDFVHMAEMLVKYTPMKSSKASGTEDEKAAGGNGAEAEREDLSVRERKAKEPVRKSRTIHNEPALDRREQFHFKERA
jgi:hypothetical protein